jgi:hypothetical protein
MELINSIQLDMVKKGNAPVVYAVQNEFYTRIISANLFANGFPFDATGCVASVAYKKPDGTSGWYDTLPDGTVAYTSVGNNVSVSIAPQMLSVAGIVNAAIRIETADGLHRAVTFPFCLDVAEDPGANGVKSENYYSVQNWDDVNEKISQIEADIERLESQGGGGGGNGGIFIPSVSQEGIISWTNNAGLPNPEPVNIKGENGYTPVRGTDYWTEADKAEMVASVIAALPVYDGEVL